MWQLLEVGRAEITKSNSTEPKGLCGTMRTKQPELTVHCFALLHCSANQTREGGGVVPGLSSVCVPGAMIRRIGEPLHMPCIIVAVHNSCWGLKGALSLFGGALSAVRIVELFGCRETSTPYFRFKVLGHHGLTFPLSCPTNLCGQSVIVMADANNSCCLLFCMLCYGMEAVVQSRACWGGLVLRTFGRVWSTSLSRGRRSKSRAQCTHNARIPPLCIQCTNFTLLHVARLTGPFSAA